jgi:hypothetical protein
MTNAKSTKLDALITQSFFGIVFLVIAYFLCAVVYALLTYDGKAQELLWTGGEAHYFSVTRWQYVSMALAGALFMLLFLWPVTLLLFGVVIGFCYLRLWVREKRIEK